MNARTQRNDERLRQFNLNLYAGIAVYNSSTHVINLHVFYVDFLLIDQWKLKKKDKRFFIHFMYGFKTT